MRFWDIEFLSYVNDNSNFTVPLPNNNNIFVYFQNIHGPIFLQWLKLSYIQII